METAEDTLESFYAALRNLDTLERGDFREIIKSQFNPTLRERYLTVNYHRAAFNVEMMLAIKDTKQFQALSLLARAIFELAVEMKSIAVDPKAAEKIELFSKVELLKASRRLVEFKTKHPDERIHHEMQEQFITQCGPAIALAEAAMWPPNPVTGRSPSVKHWTLKDLFRRATDLGPPFDRIYSVHYAQMSWMTHPGFVSPLNMTAEWVASYLSVVYSAAIDSYMEILEILVNVFKLSTTNEHIKKKIICNRDLGLTRTPEQAEAEMRKHGLWGYFEPPKPSASAD